jgi:hypothetical protein
MNLAVVDIRTDQVTLNSKEENVIKPAVFLRVLLVCLLLWWQSHHSSISAASLRTLNTISAPYFGGEIYIALAITFSCASIFVESCALPSPSTTVKQPIRSPANSLMLIYIGWKIFGYMHIIIRLLGLELHQSANAVLNKACSTWSRLNSETQKYKYFMG